MYLCSCCYYCYCCYYYCCYCCYCCCCCCCCTGLGYRAKFVKETAQRLNELGGLHFLESLAWPHTTPEGPPYAALHAATQTLMQFPSVLLPRGPPKDPRGPPKDPRGPPKDPRGPLRTLGGPP